MLNHKELLDVIRQTNVKQGETIIVHTSYKSHWRGGGRRGYGESMWMRGIGGTEGNGVVSRVQFSIVDRDHYFDVMETPSMMGMITEWRNEARCEADSTRSIPFRFGAPRADEF